jgi:hypothetical protein
MRIIQSAARKNKAWRDSSQGFNKVARKALTPSPASLVRPLPVGEGWMHPSPLGRRGGDEGIKISCEMSMDFVNAVRLICALCGFRKIHRLFPAPLTLTIKMPPYKNARSCGIIS